jgi:oligoendopeptidase F
VLDLWDEITGDYLDLDFYEINHLFEMPGYYVSYAVSALAAFDIWEDCLYDPDSALAKYEKIARIPSNSKDTKFLEALKSCGFSDVMTKEYINVLAQELSDYADDYKNR